MSTAAVMLVRDEADIIEQVVRHLLEQVDEVIVSDNGSVDGTREILDGMEGLVVIDDPEPGYYQARKTTALARFALERGHGWVIPCDADEIWYVPDAPFERRAADVLAGMPPDMKVVRAPIWNHFPSKLDPPNLQIAANVPPPGLLRCIGYRHREHQPARFGKVACRLLPGLEIEMGNHAAHSPGLGGEVFGDLAIRHFSWRSPEQFIRKVRNGAAAYRATDLGDEYGTHWRDYDRMSDDELAELFHAWFWIEDPLARDDVVFDPAPILGTLVLLAR